jgi:hypothetical protein
LITKPPLPATISDNSTTLVLSFLPNTTYDLPAFGLPFILLSSLPTIKSSGYLVSNAGDVNGDGLDDLIVTNYGGDPSKVHAVTGKSYVVFGLY